MASPAFTSLLVLAAAAAEAELTVAEAISAALQDNPGLAAGRARVESRRAEARARALAGLPTLSVSGLATATNDPLVVFGMRLQERSVAASDFDPARLNSAEVIGALGAAAQASLPVYAGGRLTADRGASAARAAAEEAEQRARRQQLALAVVAAYFGARVAEEALAAAREALEDAREIERLVAARVAQDMQQRSEAARASAFRAKAEAELVAAQQRAGDARDELALLVGDGAHSARLASPLAPEGPAPEESSARERPDVAAARQQELAARAEVAVARSAGYPQVGVQVRGGALWGGGSALGAFATAGLEARWDLLSPTRGAQVEAAQGAAAAAAAQRRWTELQAEVDLVKARRATRLTRARAAAAREALDAARAARDLSRARHREGLLPLTDLLDAETALTAARLTLLEARLAERMGWAQLQRALGRPVEGVGE